MKDILNDTYYVKAEEYWSINRVIFGRINKKKITLLSNILCNIVRQTPLYVLG